MLRTIALAGAALTAAVAGAAQAATYVPGTYVFTATTAGTYTISATGAQGGSAFGQSVPRERGGYGATAAGDFLLAAGDQLRIGVGAAGAVNGTSGRGGGGSFVYLVGSDAVLVAGGGGGGATTADFTQPGSPSAQGGDAQTGSAMLSVSGGDVDGVDGMDGACCGTVGRPGAGGLSSIGTSSGAYLGGGSIVLASGGGAGSVTITAPVVPAVPEPATWAMMLAGFGMVGGAARRGRRGKARPA